jgi:type II secretory pathway pseudopilin PulG
VWNSLIAVLGTLAGVVLASLMQYLTDARGRRERQRQALAAAISDLLVAVLTLREQQWLKIAATRDGQPDTPDARAQRYAARSRLTVAHDQFAMTTNAADLLAAARKAGNAALELCDIDTGPADNGRFSPDIEGYLAEIRNRTRRTHTALRELGAARVHA